MRTVDFQRICDFIGQHHLLTLSTVQENLPYGCSAFYDFHIQTVSFVIASDIKTRHIHNVLDNPNVAVTIALETDDVRTLRGVQCHGTMAELESSVLTSEYFKTFPYAKIMRPRLWCITVDTIKFTDNRLGFGKKLIWKRELLA